MQGKIVKGIAGFYYVHVVESGIYECKAKGVFRKDKIKPLVGDNVEILVLNEQEKEGNITDILPRKNTLIRPAVANIDQALVVFALQQPTPHLNLLDRFIAMMEYHEIPPVLLFNKEDLDEELHREYIRSVYHATGYPMVFTSVKLDDRLSQVREVIQGKITAIAGPSGVGKSSIINLLQSNVSMEIGELSDKIKRGKHTTRHSELITINEDTYIMDTPGFSSLYTLDIEAEQLRFYFAEFREYEGMCRFNGCNHIHEPGCSVKSAVESGVIHRSRYDNYVLMFDELKGKKPY